MKGLNLADPSLIPDDESPFAVNCDGDNGYLEYRDYRIERGVNPVRFDTRNYYGGKSFKVENAFFNTLLFTPVDEESDKDEPNSKTNLYRSGIPSPNGQVFVTNKVEFPDNIFNIGVSTIFDSSVISDFSYWKDKVNAFVDVDVAVSFSNSWGESGLSKIKISSSCMYFVLLVNYTQAFKEYLFYNGSAEGYALNVYVRYSGMSEYQLVNRIDLNADLPATITTDKPYCVFNANSIILFSGFFTSDQVNPDWFISERLIPEAPIADIITESFLVDDDYPTTIEITKITDSIFTNRSLVCKTAAYACVKVENDVFGVTKAHFAQLYFDGRTTNSLANKIAGRSEWWDDNTDSSKEKDTYPYRAYILIEKTGASPVTFSDEITFSHSCNFVATCVKFADIETLVNFTTDDIIKASLYVQVQSGNFYKIEDASYTYGASYTTVSGTESTEEIFFAHMRDTFDDGGNNLKGVAFVQYGTEKTIVLYANLNKIIDEINTSWLTTTLTEEDLNGDLKSKIIPIQQSTMDFGIRRTSYGDTPFEQIQWAGVDKFSTTTVFETIAENDNTKRVRFHSLCKFRNSLYADVGDGYKVYWSVPDYPDMWLESSFVVMDSRITHLHNFMDRLFVFQESQINTLTDQLQRETAGILEPVFVNKKYYDKGAFDYSVKEYEGKLYFTNDSGVYCITAEGFVNKLSTRIQAMFDEGFINARVFNHAEIKGYYYIITTNVHSGLSVYRDLDISITNRAGIERKFINSIAYNTRTGEFWFGDRNEEWFYQTKEYFRLASFHNDISVKQLKRLSMSGQGELEVIQYQNQNRECFRFPVVLENINRLVRHTLRGFRNFTMSLGFKGNLNTKLRFFKIFEDGR